MASWEPVRIPDVSNHQGVVDWAAVVRSGRAGGICKATEGLTFIDGTFGRNWAALRLLGAQRGAYHFARPGAGAPEAQADRFLSVVNAAGRVAGDMLVLDLEVGDGDLDDFAVRWLGRVEQHTGTTPWFYSYGPFIRGHLTDKRLARYPLWLAAYSSRPPAAPAPWTSWQLWQHTDKAAIPGISTPCDESTGTLPATVSVTPPAAPAVVPIPVYDYEESAVKTTLVVIGPLDDKGCGWSDWQCGLGRDPRIVGVTQLGPSPPDDGPTPADPHRDPYWMGQAKVNLSAQPRGEVLRVVVRGGIPGDTVSAWAAVA